MSILALALGSVATQPPIATNNGPVSGIGTGTVTAGPVQIFVEGGSPPYTYFAEYEFGDPCTITGASTSTPGFQRTGVVGIDQFQGIVRVTVTDNKNRVATTLVEWFISGGFS